MIFLLKYSRYFILPCSTNNLINILYKNANEKSYFSTNLGRIIIIIIITSFNDGGDELMLKCYISTISEKWRRQNNEYVGVLTNYAH